MSTINVGMRKRLWVLVGSLTFLYLIMLWSWNGLPFLDLPNHLTRATILRDLWFNHGETYHRWFTFRVKLVPYILGDVFLVLLASLFEIHIAGKILVIFSFLSFPTAVFIYLRVNRYSRYATSIAMLYALYLSTDWFFLAGFEHYRISIGLVLLIISLWGMFVDRKSKFTLIAYSGILFVAYFFHLSSLILSTAAIVFLSSYRLYFRKVSNKEVFLSSIPIISLFVFYFMAGGGISATDFFWGPLNEKVLRLGSSLIRFGPLSEMPIIISFLGCCLFLLIVGGRRKVSNSCVIEPLGLSGIFFFLYIVMPVGWQGIYDVDNRALPLFFTFLLFAGLARVEEDEKSKVPVLLAIAAATLNLATLWAHLQPHNQSIMNYERVIQHVPIGSRVLPVATRPDDGRVQVYLHVGCWATVDRQALTPYIFSERSGSPMSYFRYRVRMNAPSLFWYIRSNDKIQWDKIREQFDYIVITYPFDAKRIALKTVMLERNDDAALLRIVKSTN